MTDDAKRLVETLQNNDEWYKRYARGSYLARSGIMALSADMIEKLSADRDAWKRRCEAAEWDLRSAVRGTDVCRLCAHYHPCGKDVCPQYISGSGATGWNGKEHPDLRWACVDFDADDCPAWKNTPCHECDSVNHWQWRGPCAENGGEHNADKG